MTRALALKLVLALAVVPHPVHKAQHRRHRLGAHFTVSATAYTPCSSGSVMADGHRTYFGAVASNRHRLGTLLRFDHLLMGRRYFRVRDTGSAAMQLDIWLPSCRDGIAFGRRTLGYRVVLGGAS